jgi:hypothetical protein
MNLRASARGAASPAPRISIVYRAIHQLKPDPANPRLHSNKQIRQIANSIATFGFNVPVLVDADLNVIAGHGRGLACRELGWSEVPTICLDRLSSAQARAFTIADNRLTEIATWDDRLLARQLRDLSLLGLDFDLEVTGFETGESICVSPLWRISQRRMTIRRMSCRRSRLGRHSASLTISGSSAAIAYCAAALSIPLPSRH